MTLVFWVLTSAVALVMLAYAFIGVFAALSTLRLATWGFRFGLFPTGLSVVWTYKDFEVLPTPPEPWEVVFQRGRFTLIQNHAMWRK